MTTLEQVEKLRERADVSFEEAKAALEAADGDLLDAIILLEKQGKTAPPPTGGNYSYESDAPDWVQAKENFKHAWKENGHGFKEFMKKVGSLLLRLIDIGNSNYLDAIHKEETVLSCPVTVLVILLIFFFWVVVPVLVVGLFFGWRYRFRGTQLGREDINGVIEKAENAAEEMKKSVTEKE
ncbi:MAG: ubiquitin [Oscillospiraceae bacterium]|jgi:hypothetical protein|nr:ubiquitin [Oscillospiraceae bacterium]